MKKADVGALLIFQITNPSDTVVDLTTATTAILTIYNGNTKSLKTMNFYSRTAGKVSYSIQPGDLASTGVYKFEVYIELTGGGKFTSSRAFDVVEPTL